MKESVISAKNVSIGYHKSTYGSETELYKNLSFNLYSRELTCLLGQNGAGKSTLLRTLSASQSSLSGDIFLYDKNIRDYSEAELSYKIGLVLTDKTSIGGFKVFQLVALGRYPYTGFWGRLSKSDKDIIQKAMEDVGISEKANSYIAQLSDGERQKVMIAKALAQECPIVFLDEPTAFLDVSSRIEIMSLLHNLATEQNKSILLSTHDIELALMLADRIWLLSPKRGLECGVTEDVVLSGLMNDFLSNKDIQFDMNSGSFFPRKAYNRYTFLSDKIKDNRWLVNFLQRNYWGTTLNKEEALFSIEDISTECLRIIHKGQNLSFPSFEKFRDWLVQTP